MYVIPRSSALFRTSIPCCSSYCTKRLPPPKARMDTWAPVRPSVRIGMPDAEIKGVATAPSAAVPRKSRLDIPIGSSSPEITTMPAALFAEQVQHDAAPVVRGTMLENVYTLPGAECEPALFD